MLFSSKWVDDLLQQMPFFINRRSRRWRGGSPFLRPEVRRPPLAALKVRGSARENLLELTPKGLRGALSTALPTHTQSRVKDLCRPFGPAADRAAKSVHQVFFMPIFRSIVSYFEAGRAQVMSSVPRPRRAAGRVASEAPVAASWRGGTEFGGAPQHRGSPSSTGAMNRKSGRTSPRVPPGGLPPESNAGRRKEDFHVIAQYPRHQLRSAGDPRCAHRRWRHC